jgi:ubiquinone/menaquinone biosynthesis C-methylase UbiE
VAIRERQIVSRAITGIAEGGGPSVRRIVDLPCGTGKLAPVFARHRISVVAADISREMMDVAEAEYRKIPGFVGLVQADATATEFRDEEFDAAVCLRLLHRVPDTVREIMLAEISRISRHYVIISAGVTDRLQEARRTLRRWTTGTSTVPYPVTRDVLTSQLSRAGLDPLRWVPVLPVLSSEWVVICAKRGVPQ